MNPQGPGLHDIEGLIPYAVPWWQYALLAVGIIFLLVLLVLLWQWWKKKKASTPQPVDPFAHWHALSRQAQGLQPELVMAQGGAKELYFQYSLILRTAIEYATGARATDMTFREVQPLVRRKLSVHADVAEQMLAFLQTADLVKFADRETTEAEAVQFKQELIGWILELKPRAEIPLPAAHIKSVPVSSRSGGQA